MKNTKIELEISNMSKEEIIKFFDFEETKTFAHVEFAQNYKTGEVYDSNKKQTYTIEQLRYFIRAYTGLHSQYLPDIKNAKKMVRKELDEKI